MDYFAHETACIDTGAQIGAGTHIWHFCHIRQSAIIGKSCNIGQNVFIDGGARMGNNCKIQNNVSIYSHVTLEDNVFCGPSMVFTNVFNPRADIKKMDQARPTLVREGATLGANAVIVCGVTVGRRALVAAGAVVTRDVPDHALVMGNPARKRGWVCRCGHTLDAQLHCPDCGLNYTPCPEGLRKI